MDLRASGGPWMAALLGAVLAAAGAEEAWAQAPTQPAGTAQQLNPARQTEAAARGRAGDVFSAPEAAPCPLSSSKLEFTLQSVEVEGSKTLSDVNVRDAYADMAGKQIPVGTICEIRDRLSMMLFRRGILARVEIPPQEIAAGHVKLQVFEARIVSVRYHTEGDVGPAQAKVEEYLNRLRGLTPFDLDTAQRYLLMANDVPGMRVTAALRPSTSAATNTDAGRGAIDLDVAIARQDLDVVAAVQNTSSKALGPWSAIGRLDLNSFTSFGERTTLIAYSTLGNNEQEVVQLLEEARFGDQGLMARGSFAYGRSRPGDVLAPLKLQGESFVGTAELAYPLIRLRRHSLIIGAGMDFINQSTDFPGGGALSDDALRVIWGRVTGTGFHQFVNPSIGEAITTTGAVELDVRKGIDGLGASRAGAPALSRIDGKPDALVIRADAQGGIRFEPMANGLPIGLSFHAQGQWADRPLLSYEEQPIGNLTIGRGYDPDSLSGDRVIASEFRGQVGPWRLGRAVSLAPYGFYDIAYVTNLDPGSQNRTVRSVGGGAELHIVPWDLRADIAYAKPLDKPFASALVRPPARVLVQIVFAR